MMANMDCPVAGAGGVLGAVSLLAGGLVGPEGKDHASTPLKLPARTSDHEN